MTVLKLRLGSKCNQNCTFCHSNKQDNYEFNPKLIPFIKYSIPYVDKINYGGGEPLIYWNTIKYIIDKFPNLMHHIVSNGSLFNEEMLEYTRKYKLHIGISLNKFTNISDHTYKLLAQVPNLGIARLYTGNETFDELDEMLDEFNHRLGNRQLLANYNIMHTTSSNESISYTEEQINHYITEMDKRITRAIIFLKNGLRSKYMYPLNNLIYINRRTKFYNPKPYGCCTYIFESISLDGRYMPCPYIMDYMCSIEEPNDYRYASNKNNDCLKCELFGRCTSCYKSINNDECRMLNGVIMNMHKAIENEGLTVDEVLNMIHSNGNDRFNSFDYRTDD